jgi:tetratricopeptide (TPR) repeat protein
MARWTAFAASGDFAYDGGAVLRHWRRLHACDREPLPDSPGLVKAWAHFHNGHFEQAHRLGLRLGDAGTTVANLAACVYATQLASQEQERLALYQAVVERATAQCERQPENPNAHYLLAMALGRYSQGISVARALAQGMGSRIKTALETTIALQPQHADAHFALGAFHADMIDKVGALIGSMTFGAKKDVSLQMFQQGFALQPHSPAGLVEYALALLILEGDARLTEASALYQKAAALKPTDAREYLDIAIARNGLTS